MPDPVDGQEKGGIETSIPRALIVGGERQGLTDEVREISGELGDITDQVVEVETRYEHDKAYLEAHHGLELADLEAKRTPLLERRSGVETDIKSARSRVAHWTGKLRTLATKPGALRGDQLLYATFATDGAMSQEGLDRIAAVDDLTRDNGGEVVAVLQRGHFAFGKLQQDNDGLIIDTRRDSESAEKIRRVHLPVEGNPSDEERTPHFGWVSGRWDDRNGWDNIQEAFREEEDQTIEGFCRFDIENSHLFLPHPTDFSILREFSGELDSAEVLSEENSTDLILVGQAAVDYFHALIDSRLAAISAHGKESALDEFGRLNVIAIQLGMTIDASRFEKFKP